MRPREQAVAVDATVPLGGLLAVQAEVSGRRQDHLAREHGEVLLAELSRLQVSLLGGRSLEGAGSEGASLLRLMDLARKVPPAADTALADALGALALRAQIELARRGMG